MSENTKQTTPSINVSKAREYLSNWINRLNRYEKYVYQLCEITEGVYWTKIKQFNHALGVYSDPINDHYWTLVIGLTVRKDQFNGLVDEVELFFTKLNKKHSYYLYPADQRGYNNLLRKRGFRIAIRDNYMFHRGGAFYAPPINPHIQVKKVTNTSENEIYIDTYSRAFETDPNDVYFDYSEGNVYQEIYRKTWLDKKVREKVHRFVAFYDGKPGAIGALYFNNGLGYLSEIGTDPKFRKQGMATAISIACLETANREKCKTIMLITEGNSPAYRLYKKLGFSTKVVCHGWTKA